MAGINWIGLLQPQDSSLPAQPGGCARCHPTYGPKPNPIEELTEADYQNVDCLMCHGPDYKRTVVKEGDAFKLVAAEGVDLLAVAQNAQKPTSEMCLRCHTGTGGGPNAKHGVIPTVDTDVHLAGGVQCVECHVSEDHKIAGGADLKAHDLPDVQISCSDCHGKAPHRDEAVLNDHIERIACQTCHIPAIARDPKMPTVVERDYTQPVYVDQTGLYAPTNVWVNDVMPEYYWWNGRMVNPPTPVGSVDDPDSRITPWKRADYRIISDKATGEPALLKLGVYFITGDPLAAAAKGAEAAGKEFSGEIDSVVESLLFSVNHQVAPSDQALACEECHSEEGRLDFVALGYSPEQASELVQARYEPAAEAEEAAEAAAGAAEAEAEAPAAPEELPATGTSGSLPPLALAGALSLLVVAGGLAVRRHR